MQENVLLFDDAIRAAKSKTVLYMTWARQHALESQRAISEAYTSIGREIGATVIPVGIVWQKFLRKHDSPVLYDKDGSHPTLAGSYLAACVFLAKLLKENPQGIDLDIAGLDAKIRVLLQKSAWQECKSIAKETSSEE